MVELDERRLRAFFQDGANFRVLEERYPGARRREEEERRDWVQAARDLLQPMEVGERFFLAPEWRDDPAPPERFRIAVNPGMAFGTGVHETTQLALEARACSTWARARGFWRRRRACWARRGYTAATSIRLRWRLRQRGSRG
jgi:ribosomal protein L11 methylase PrmA